MGTFLQLDEFKRETLIGYVESLEIPFTSTTLQFLPRDKQIFSLDFGMDIYEKHNVVAANLNEFGTPAPLRDKQGLARVFGEVAKMSHKYRFDERDALTIMNPRHDKERQQVIDKAFDYVDNLKMGVEETEEYLRTSILYKGKIDYNIDGFTVEIPFNVPKAVKVITKWSDHENSNPIKDLIDLIEKFKKTNAGRKPLELHMSNLAYLDILQSKSIIGNIKGSAGGMVTPEELANFLTRWKIPPIVTNDLEITFENGKTERYLPENRIVFLGIDGKSSLGSTVEGPTKAKKGQPGVYVKTWEEDNTGDEFIEIGKAAFPELNYPSGVMQIDV
ncbi:major capsid protein [Bacillus hominis]|uniref:Major capsid protein n=1 Tax=Bacillus hominis TaxID=2817478 RepID=A0ABT7R6Y0_9BACI|nr:major capsid protein [Bacillus hominis]MDM5193538.1 major capsid protein [Bacillus hominis]MDM5433262.1 major capsid protein [Bacillus hominis]MDM5438683.1 major capsid protein [Bacillus hominis]SCM94488.1 Uncharacterized protein BWINRASL_02156 [Bacillus mycoides]